VPKADETPPAAALGAASLIPARGGFASPEPVFVPRALHSAVLRYNPAAGTRERLMRPWPFVVAFFLSPILVFAADQQQPAVPSVGEVIEVSIVNLDVVVTDKRGKRVHGLTRDDFVILEDGKLQPITNFAEYGAEAARAVTTRGSAPPTSPAKAEAPPPQKRTMVVFVDRFKLVDFRREPIFAAV